MTRLLIMIQKKMKKTMKMGDQMAQIKIEDIKILTIIITIIRVMRRASGTPTMICKMMRIWRTIATNRTAAMTKK